MRTLAFWWKKNISHPMLLHIIESRKPKCLQRKENNYYILASTKSPSIISYSMSLQDSWPDTQGGMVKTLCRKMTAIQQWGRLLQETGACTTERETVYVCYHLRDHHMYINKEMGRVLLNTCHHIVWHMSSMLPQTCARVRRYHNNDD